MQSSRQFLLCSNLLKKTFNYSSICFYSRKSDASNADTYKVVTSSQTAEDFDSGCLESPPNWELLNPQGYRFYLPGGVAPAWYDPSSTALPYDPYLGVSSSSKIQKHLKKSNSSNTFDFTVQECPLLLRKGVEELFPGVDLISLDVNIATLTHRTRITNSRDPETEREKLVKCFVVVAQELCTKLKIQDYWADFINPFSGKPYMGPIVSPSLYNTDTRFRCLGFQINQFAQCKVIATYTSANLTGSIFTTAPTSVVTKLLKNLFQDIQ